MPERDELEVRPKAVAVNNTPNEVCPHGVQAHVCKKCKDAARQRIHRDELKKRKVAASQETEQAWWEHNRALLKPDELAAMQAQDEYVRDLMLSMQTVIDVKVSDPELIYIIIGFVKEQGVTHLGAITKSEIPANWPTRRYWADADLLNKLTGENPQTEQYVKYGLLSALPDWQVVEFLHKKAGWIWNDAADLVGYRTNQRLNHPSVMSYSTSGDPSR
jgi:hypothetical protein